MAPKARSKSSGRSGAKAKPKAKSKGVANASAGSVPGLTPKETPLTAEEKEWCEGFQGVPLSSVSVDVIPVPPTLTTPQVRIWKRIWEQGQEVMRRPGSEHAADDAMREVVQRMYERAADAASDDNRIVIDHVRVWLRWFDESAAAALSFLDVLGDDDDD
mmetsp:Transcript_36040/g.64746  ORF Transcript_36040/g.64746 Transcript_36040/m.64746 type:complete len:160 (-) Transcript_36040:123-602(-)